MTIEAIEKRPPVISTTRRGDVQLWSGTLIPTTKDAPADAEAPSHRLLSRGGYIRRVTAGVYDYLPLAWRVLRKIEAIVRDEMHAAGASEMLMPAITPIELFAETGRAEAYGPLLFKLEDRHGRVAALGPTHEEVITELMRGVVSSYKSLPLNLYQIQTKFRDEFRPRAGLLRGREFIMKDAYSFHMEVEGKGGLNEGYEAMYKAYVNIFTRCGLDFTVVEAESGPIGGSASHEFMVNCESGEDTILRCPKTGYAANVEKCETGAREWSFDGEPVGDLEEIHTPNCPGIEDVCAFMKVKAPNMLKTLVFVENIASGSDYSWSSFEAGVGEMRAALNEVGIFSLNDPLSEDDIEQAIKSHPDYQATRSSLLSSLRELRKELAKFRFVVAVVRGDHEVNEGKLKAQSGARELILPSPELLRLMGIPIGFLSPRIAASPKLKAVLLVDPDAAQGMDKAKGKSMFWATGADKADHHVKKFNWKREMGALLQDGQKVKVADIRNAMAGDPSPRAEGAVLEARKGIEVGHIFKLGTKYSDAMGFSILDQHQQKRSVIMGCYGIGVSRTMAACVEMSHDENGILWPLPIAPFHVLITPMKVEADSQAMRVAKDLAQTLAGAGFDVLIDDRDERPGFKFKDADLIGIPIRLTLGDKALAEDSAEFKLRSDTQSKGEMVKLAKVVERCLAAAE